MADTRKKHTKPKASPSPMKKASRPVVKKHGSKKRKSCKKSGGKKA
jgi:hypothetical protein